MDIQRKLITLLRLIGSSEFRREWCRIRLIQRRILFVQSKNVFDVPYYFATLKREGRYPEDDGGFDPVWDFLQLSGKDFLPRLAEADGWCYIASPHPLFDVAFYLLRYYPRGLSENPFVHYLKRGWKKGFWPGPYFDPEVYRKRSTWSESLGDPLTHFSHAGRTQGISTGFNFEVDWYNDSNPILSKSKVEWEYRFYKEYGGPGGKSPLPLFDPAYYLSQLTESRVAPVMDAYAHFFTTGAKRGLRPSPWFDVDLYRMQVGGKLSRTDALVHYVYHGVYQGILADSRISALKDTPVISLLVPVYNPDLGELNNCIRSVLYQAYPFWELCLADDASSDPEVREVLKGWAAKDSRIKLSFLADNRGISGATNEAASLAGGEYVGFLDNDDELSTDCLFKIVCAINETGADFIYTDENLIGNDGSQLSVFRKPDFDPELLLSHNYICHFVVASRELFDRAGGFVSACDGAQDFDMALKLTEMATKIHHLPEVLYHWRATATSTSIDHSQKDYAHEAGRNSLRAALERRNLKGEVVDTELNFYYRITFSDGGDPPPPGRVFALFNGSNGRDFMPVVHSLRDTLPENYTATLLLPDFLRVPPGSEADLGGVVEVAHYDIRHGFAAQLNQLVHGAPVEELVLTLADGLRYEGDWVQALQAPELGAKSGMVCGRILNNGRDGDSYTLPDIGNVSPFYFHEFLRLASRHVNGMHCGQLVPCCCWELVKMRKSLFETLGGIDAENFPLLFGMLDFSRKCVDEGKVIKYTPHACLNRSQPLTESLWGSEDGMRLEKAAFQQRWRSWLQDFDPMYNVGILGDNGLDVELFRNWLTGQASAH